MPTDCIQSCCSAVTHKLLFLLRVSVPDGVLIITYCTGVSAGHMATYMCFIFTVAHKKKKKKNMVLLMFSCLVNYFTISIISYTLTDLCFVI